MITQTNNLTKDPIGDMSTYERPSDAHHLSTITRIVGVSTAIVVCGVGADVAYHRHVMGLYVTAASGAIFFLEVTWAITLFVQLCVRNEDSLCSRCWSRILTATRGWRRALFYLPLSFVLAWRPNKLWLSYVAGKDVDPFDHMVSEKFHELLTSVCTCSWTVGDPIPATYCIKRARISWSLPVECRYRLGRREPAQLQAGKLRPIRRGSGDGSSRRRCVRTRTLSRRQRWRDMTRATVLLGQRIRR
ncbi:hypothetical protein PUN28_018806 [Cardiocondyla obscurior]|uniref:Transmembrane protein n=1 Tax=Cardiocondyla obscurior TaxID=286306 RepID=A0AAW2EG18_9HYME